METILVDRQDGVVTVTLNRPERKNAVNHRMWRELDEVFAEVADEPEDRVLVITGAGGAFCSGADLTSAGAPEGRSTLTAMRMIGGVALRLHRLSKPTIAKVNGVAAGAGCNMALGCDLIVASEEASFIEIFSRRGLTVDFGGSWLLPRLVGLHKAKEMVLLADSLSADDAVALGLINRSVPAGQLDNVVDDWARRLAAGPPLALSMSKNLLNQGVEMSFDQALEAEAQAQAVNARTDDTAEAMRAFAAKRQPRFEGR